MNESIFHLRQPLAQYSQQHGHCPVISILDFLWEQYTNEHPLCDERIKHCEAALAPIYEALPWESSNELFLMVCELCLAYQRAAFLDGLQAGFQLADELQ